MGLKKIIKRILPPPVTSFMREVDRLNDSIWRSKGETYHQIETLYRKTETLEETVNAQNANLYRLTELFGSLNKENLRLYLSIDSISEDLKAIREELVMNNELIEKRANENRDALVEITRHLDTLRGMVACNCDILEGANDSLETFGRLNDELKTQVGDEVHNLNGRIDGVMRAVKRLSLKQDELLNPTEYARVITNWYQNKTGQIIDINNPVTYNEKIQWMKVFDNDPRKTLLSDKLYVREWVSKAIGDKYLIPLIAVYEKSEEIDFKALPRQFVLKATHGSGWNKVVMDKDAINIDVIRKTADRWLETDFAFVNGYEMHYHNIPRKLLVEEYIGDSKGNLPDYKMWCFDGKVHYIMYLTDRQSKLKMAFYDCEWNRLNISYDHPQVCEEIPKPVNLDEMIWIAERLSEGFAHVRVDLYLPEDGSIRFGEMTFSSSSGICRWAPSEADKMMGDLFNLPIKRIN